MNCRLSVASIALLALVLVSLASASPLRVARQAGSGSHGHTADPTADSAKADVQTTGRLTSGGRSGSVLHPDLLTEKSKRDLKTSGIGGPPSSGTSDISGIVTGYAMDPSKSPGVTGSDVGYKTGSAGGLLGTTGPHTMIGSSVGNSGHSDVAGRAQSGTTGSGNTSGSSVTGSAGQMGALDSSKSSNVGDIIGHGVSSNVGSSNQSGTSGSGLRLATGKIGGQG